MVRIVSYLSHGAMVRLEHLQLRRMLIPQPRQLTLLLLIQLADDAIGLIIGEIACQPVKKKALRQKVDPQSWVAEAVLW